MAVEIARLKAVVGADTRDAEKGFARVSDRIGTLSKTFAVAGAAAAAGLAVGLGAAVTAAAGFEKTMSGVKAVSGASGEELKQLSSLALQLGKDTSFSAAEAAKGLEELVKGGVSVADIMGGAALASLNLAAAGEIDLASAAEIAANAMNMFGLQGADMAMVSDQIAGAANASSLSVSDFRLSLNMVGAVAKLAGQDFKSTATAIALMGAAGIKSSDAGTSLKTMLMNLQPSTKPAIKAFRELGILTKDGANAFFDAAGKAKGMRDIAEILRESMKGLTEQQKLAKLEIMFGTDAIRAAAVLADQGAAGYDKMAESMNKVTAASVAAERLNNVSGAMEQLKGSVETAAITLGSAFLPQLKGIIDNTTSAVNAAIPFIETYGPGLAAGLSASVSTMASLAVDGFQATAAGVETLVSTGQALHQFFTDNTLAAEALGAVLVGVTAAGMAKMLTGVPQMASQLGHLSLAWGAHTAAVGASAAAMALAALPFIAFAAVAATVVLAGYQIYKNWDLLKFGAEVMGAKVGQVWGDVKTDVAEAASSVRGSLDAAGRATDAFAQGVASTIADGLGRATGAFDSFTAATEGRWGLFVGHLIGHTMGFVKDAAREFLALDANVKATLTTLATEMPGILGRGLDSAYAAIVKWDEESTAAVQSFASDTGTAISVWDAETSAAVTAWATNSLATIQQWDRDMVAAFEQWRGKAVQTVGQFASDAWAELKKWDAAFTQAGMDLIMGFINGIRSAIPTAIQAVTQFGLDLISAARNALDSHSPSRAFHEIGADVSRGLALGIISEAGTVQEALDKLISEEQFESSFKGLVAGGAIAGAIEALIQRGATAESAIRQVSAAYRELQEETTKAHLKAQEEFNAASKAQQAAMLEAHQAAETHRLNVEAGYQKMGLSIADILKKGLGTGMADAVALGKQAWDQWLQQDRIGALGQRVDTIMAEVARDLSAGMDPTATFEKARPILETYQAELRKVADEANALKRTQELLAHATETAMLRSAAAVDQFRLATQRANEEWAKNRLFDGRTAADWAADARRSAAEHEQERRREAQREANSRPSRLNELLGNLTGGAQHAFGPAGFVTDFLTWLTQNQNTKGLGALPGDAISQIAKALKLPAHVDEMQELLGALGAGALSVGGTWKGYVPPGVSDVPRGGSINWLAGAGEDPMSALRKSLGNVATGPRWVPLAAGAGGGAAPINVYVTIEGDVNGLDDLDRKLAESIRRMHGRGGLGFLSGQGA